LEKLAPFNPDPNVYHHNRTGEDNADAHLKRQAMGRDVVVAITKGKLDFGPWEQIFYGEFDGHRPKPGLVNGIWWGPVASHISLFGSAYVARPESSKCVSLDAVTPFASCFVLPRAHPKSDSSRTSVPLVPTT